MATSGTPIPVVSQPWQIEHLLAGTQGSVFAQIESNARANLGVCYANVSMPPASCDADYSSALFQLGSYLVWPSLEWSQLMGAVQAPSNRAQVAQGNRDINTWFSPSEQRFSFYRIGISLGFLSNFLLMDQYNQALIAARKQKQCNLWYATWDGNSCDAY